MMSTEVAYYTYIYTKVNKQFYEKVTTYTRGAFLLGRFTAGVVGQTTTSFGYLDYEELNYLTLTCKCKLEKNYLFKEQGYFKPELLHCE